MKTATVLTLFLATAAAFNAPQFATRAVGAKKAAPKKAGGLFGKKAAPAKAAPAPSAPPASQGYPSFAADAQKFSLGSISGGGNKAISPVFVHPTINNEPVPDFDYVELGKQRLAKKSSDFAYDDGLTVLERKQKSTIPAFLTGSAKSNIDQSSIRDDIEVSDYPFGLDADRFQLLFISAFGLFTLVGCLSGSISLD